MKSIVAVMAPDVVYATTRRIAEAMDELGAPIAVVDGHSAGLNHDVGRMLAADVTESGMSPWKERPTSTPELGRHHGRSIVMCYQPTDTTPARYLSAALERAGVRVEHRYPRVELDDLPIDAFGVVFVESPYPALDVNGTTALPIVYWTHHGEHHIHQNLRLAESYRADAVLLAHSWHLGHRFAVPTFRFPFGVPLEMVNVQAPWEERPIDVAMVGAGFDGHGDGYAARRNLAKQLTSRFGSDRTVFTGGIAPEGVFATYGRAKIVVDEGGSHHRPVTMRVFEATGSGAALATDPAPGIEQLFELGLEILTLDPTDPLASVRIDDETRAIADAGQARALGVHTYDHRVDELLRILSNVEKRPVVPQRTRSRHVRAVGRFAEIDSIACAETDREAWASTSYVVWSHAEILDRQVTVDAVIINNEGASFADLVALAHRYVICSPGIASTVRSMLSADARHFVETLRDDLAVFDFEVPGYIVRGTQWPA
jgi:hypothetical protein